MVGVGVGLLRDDDNDAERWRSAFEKCTFAIEKSQTFYHYQSFQQSTTHLFVLIGIELELHDDGDDDEFIWFLFAISITLALPISFIRFILAVFLILMICLIKYTGWININFPAHHHHHHHTSTSQWDGKGWPVLNFIEQWTVALFASFVVIVSLYVMSIFFAKSLLLFYGSVTRQKNWMLPVGGQCSCGGEGIMFLQEILSQFFCAKKCRNIFRKYREKMTRSWVQAAVAVTLPLRVFNYAVKNLNIFILLIFWHIWTSEKCYIWTDTITWPVLINYQPFHIIRAFIIINSRL